VKKFYVLGNILFLFLHSIQLFGQFEWAPIGAKWYYSKNEGMSPPNVGYVKIESIKDSLFKGEIVRVLKKTYFSSEGDTVNWDNSYTFERNDTIFYWAGNSYMVLYNFMADVGEMWTVYSKEYNPCGIDSNGIIKIDSVGKQTFNDHELNYLFTSPNDTSIWNLGKIIENIGSTSYMFPLSKDCGIFDFMDIAGPLRCYQDNQLGKINFLDLPCDTLIDLISEIGRNKINEIKVYPNPTHDIVQFEFGGTKIVKIKIFNLFGSIVLIQKLSGSNHEISFYPYPSGIYFLRLEDNNGNFYLSKILKE
jgi:hypothetical protein